MTQIHVPLFRDTLSPGVIALSISYAMQMIDGFGWTIRFKSNIWLKYINIIKIAIRMAGELESDSVALERVREYEDLPQVPQQKTKRPIKQKTSYSGGRLGV